MTRTIKIKVENTSNQSKSGKLFDSNNFVDPHYGWSEEVKFTSWQDGIKEPYRTTLIHIPSKLKYSIKYIYFKLSNIKFERFRIRWADDIGMGNNVYLNLDDKEYLYNNKNVLLDADFFIETTIPPKSSVEVMIEYSLYKDIKSKSNKRSLLEIKREEIMKIIHHNKFNSFRRKENRNYKKVLK